MSIIYPIPSLNCGWGYGVVERLYCCGKECNGTTVGWICSLCGKSYDISGKETGTMGISLYAKRPAFLAQREGK